MFNIGDIIYCPDGFKLGIKNPKYLCKPTDKFLIIENPLNSNITNNYRLKVLQDMTDLDHYNYYIIDSASNNFYLPENIINIQFKLCEKSISILKPKSRFELLED